jgi:imidazolonepropionase-like amidohydrolase
LLALTRGLSAVAQERVTVLRGGEVHTIASGVIANGVVVFQGGKILEVGGPSVAIPAGAEIVEAKGLLVTPGIIDARSGFWSRSPYRKTTNGFVRE